MKIKLQKLKKLAQRGDTIMEVIIAVAVLGFIFIAAYSLANRGSVGNLQSQERVEGYKSTETQLERLKSYLSRIASPADLPASGNFCIKADDPPSVITLGTITANPENDDFSVIRGNPDALANCYEDDLYYSYINRDGDTFTVHTRWLRAGGGGVEEATFVHRIYPDIASASLGVGTVVAGAPPNYYLVESSGEPRPCPDGYSSPGGFVRYTDCASIPPKVFVNVRKISPLAGNNTPSCSHTVTQDRAGTQTTLTRPGISINQPTGGDSKAEYTLSDFSAPSFTTPTYTASVTAPTGHEVCTSTAPVPSMGLGPSPGVGSTTEVVLSIRPICYSVDDYGWVDRGKFVSTLASSTPVNAWFHDGPDWGPDGPGVPPKSAARYNIGTPGGYLPPSWTHSNGVERYDLYGTTDGWYNKFVYRLSHYDNVYQDVWQSDYKWEKIGTHNECPS